LIERFTVEKHFLRVEFVAVGLPGAADAEAILLIHPGRVAFEWMPCRPSQ